MPTFSDETPTGQTSDVFRGLGRATIAARVEDSNGFDWLLQFRRDHLPVGVEPKATLVLEVMAVKPAAEAVVNQHIGSATIVIIDLGESYRSLLANVFEHCGKAPPTRLEAIDFMAKTQLPRDQSDVLLHAARESAVHDSMIPRIEGLLREVMSPAGIPHGNAGMLVDREAIRQMDQRTFQEFLARFSAAFSDALAPDRRRAAIITSLNEQRFLTPGYVALETLGAAASVDRFFDVGNADAFSKLQEAHDAVVETLDNAKERFFRQRIRGGRLKQEDSTQLIGIQVADIAARIAAKEYEHFPHDRIAGARAVRQRFDRVLLNDQWV